MNLYGVAINAIKWGGRGFMLIEIATQMPWPDRVFITKGFANEQAILDSIDPCMSVYREVEADALIPDWRAEIERITGRNFILVVQDREAYDNRDLADFLW